MGYVYVEDVGNEDCGGFGVEEGVFVLDCIGDVFFNWMMVCMDEGICFGVQCEWYVFGFCCFYDGFDGGDGFGEWFELVFDVCFDDIGFDCELCGFFCVVVFVIQIGGDGYGYGGGDVFDYVDYDFVWCCFVFEVEGGCDFVVCGCDCFCFGKSGDGVCGYYVLYVYDVEDFWCVIEFDEGLCFGCSGYVFMLMWVVFDGVVFDGLGFEYYFECFGFGGVVEGVVCILDVIECEVVVDEIVWIDVFFSYEFCEYLCGVCVYEVGCDLQVLDLQFVQCEFDRCVVDVDVCDMIVGVDDVYDYVLGLWDIYCFDCYIDV